MKKIFLLTFVFLMGICVMAQEIAVMPISVSKTNAYGLESTSLIIAKEIVLFDKNFKLEYPKQELKLKNLMSEKNKSLNPSLIKMFSADSKTLVITSYIPQNNRLSDVWDILKISTDFDLNIDYKMEIKAVLTDNTEGVVLWQKTYEMPLGIFQAKNMTEAFDKKEKITSYARNIIAQDIVQNINLRLKPKKIDYSTRVPKSSGQQDGIGLKYKNNAPVVKITPPDDGTFEERWRNDDSFNL